MESMLVRLCPAFSQHFKCPCDTVNESLCRSEPLRRSWRAQEEEEQKRESMLGALAELAKEKEKLAALLAEEQVCSS